MADAKRVKGSLLPSEREIEYFRENFVEGANQKGRIGLLYQIDEANTKNIGTDSFYNYKPPVEVSYYLVQNPKLKVLQKIGWNPEDKNSKPMLCYLTYKDSEGNDIYPSEGAILEISAREMPHQSQYITNKFDIVSSTVDFEMNMFICNLAPHREYEEPVHDTESPRDPINENKWFNRKIIYPSTPEVNNDTNGSSLSDN